MISSRQGGLVHFTRSLAKLGREGIRVTALCPQFVETNLVTSWLRERPEQAQRAIDAAGGGLLQVDQVVAGLLELLHNGRPGSVLRVASKGQLLYWPQPQRDGPAAQALAPPPEVEVRRARHLQWLATLARDPVPSHRQVLKVHRLTTSFSEAVALSQEPLPKTAGPGQLLIRRLYTGVNASDVNFTAGRYHGTKEAERLLPFDAGFESVGKSRVPHGEWPSFLPAAFCPTGVVVSVGEGVQGWSAGSPVATLTYGGFSDFALEPASRCLPVPEATPETLALLTSGLTASIALEEAGHMGRGETVLVTAAAGGTGQFAVQLAKLAGNRVVATCSGGAKAELLRVLGADLVIDYTRESVKEVLRRECPQGVDLAFESVGGDMFATAVDSLARRGRLVIIGMMSAYKEGWPPSEARGLQEKLLWKSATVAGFFLPLYASLFRTHLGRLATMVDQGKLRVALDAHRFVGLEQAAAAVERLQSGQSSGKVFLRLGPEEPHARM